ncbi:MAG: DUF5677 domain-containing protein [Verrucomicrobia subdivision 3 bacterium]|nr:DUF5677 domain-containing protein [Limisphaerales bacterium]
MKIERIIEQSFGLLGKVLNESIALKSGEDFRNAFVYRHARNIYQLGQDVTCLLDSGHLDSCPIVVRVMLESLFKLVAAVKKPEAAAQIVLSEVEDDLGRIKTWLDPMGCAPAITRLSDFSKRLRTEHGITSNKKWNTLACAEAADLGTNYRHEYFHFSGHTHATTGGIISQELEGGRGHVLQTLLFIVVCAVGHAVQTIQTHTPQQHIDESARLLKELLKLVEKGAFQELDRYNERV